MKAVYTCIVVFLFNIRALSSITFSVSDVVANTKKHSEKESLDPEDLARWTLKDEILTLENFQINHSLVNELNNRNDRIKNAFVATIFAAYSSHYPLEISVEDFWVTIAQGIGIHLNENAEKYRQLMVSHDGKKTLNVSVDRLRLPDSVRPTYGDKSIPAINWTAAVRLMGEAIKEDMKIDLATLITNPFSNTTAVEQAVFDCTLMDTVKSYYKYRFYLECGHPQITLRGSPEDFQQIISRINQLRDIFTDFHWWFDRILPHLKQLKASAEGNPDIDWWTRICHYIGGSGSPSLTGWLTDFIPYISDGEGHYRSTRVSENFGHSPSIDLSDFSESVTRTDFILDNNGAEFKMKLIAGFLGIGQNPETGALRPCLGWITAMLTSNTTKIIAEL